MSRRSQSRRRRSYAPRQRELRGRPSESQIELDEGNRPAWQQHEHGRGQMTADKQGGAEL